LKNCGLRIAELRIEPIADCGLLIWSLIQESWLSHNRVSNETGQAASAANPQSAIRNHSDQLQTSQTSRNASSAASALRTYANEVSSTSGTFFVSDMTLHLANLVAAANEDFHV